MGKLILWSISWFLVLDTAFAFQCQQCSYFEMRILDMPGLQGYANLVSSILSHVSSNDTSCLHGNSSTRIECGDLGCTLSNLFFIHEQTKPIFGGYDLTIKVATTSVRRSCRNPAAPAQSGCVPVTLDNQIQVGPNTTLSIRQLINQRTGSGTQGSSPTKVELQGQTCHCFGVDNCNNGTTNTMPTTTSAVTMTTDPVTKATNAVTSPVATSASRCAALSFYLLSCVLFSRL